MSEQTKNLKEVTSLSTIALALAIPIAIVLMMVITAIITLFGVDIKDVPVGKIFIGSLFVSLLVFPWIGSMLDKK